MSKQLQDFGAIAQIIALLVCYVQLIISSIGLTNPEWLARVTRRPGLVGNVLLAITALLWFSAVLITFISWRSPTLDKPKRHRLFLGCCALTALLGLVVFLRVSSEPPVSCEGYGINIVSPKSNEEVSAEGTLVSGTYSTRPPSGHLVLYQMPLDRTSYSPQYEISIDTLGKKWIGRAGLTDPPGAYYGVAIVGDAGRALYDYYWQAAREANAWVPFRRLPVDTVFCDEVEVRSSPKGTSGNQ